MIFASVVLCVAVLGINSTFGSQIDRNIIETWEEIEGALEES